MKEKQNSEVKAEVIETAEFLSLTLSDLIIQIDKNFKAGYIGVRKKKSDEEIWKLWGQFMFELKMELEAVLLKDFVPILGWLYAYLQNCNQLINLYMETRVGKIGVKKSVKKSSKIMLGLISGELKTGPKDELNQKVKEHLHQLYIAKKYDIIAGRRILVADYPKEKIPEEPATILTPEDLLIKENETGS